MSRSYATPGNNSSELSLAVARGLAAPLIVFHVVAAVIVAGLSYRSDWLAAPLVIILAANLGLQLSSLRRRQGWRLILSDAEEQFLADSSSTKTVSCRFSYVSRRLVVVGVGVLETGEKRLLPFTVWGVSGEQWRRLHLMSKDGERSRPEPRS